MGHPAEERTDHNTVGATTDPAPGGLATQAGGVLSRVVITILLIPVFVALLVDAWRERGVAAPVVGR